MDNMYIKLAESIVRDEIIYRWGLKTIGFFMELVKRNRFPKKKHFYCVSIHYCFLIFINTGNSLFLQVWGVGVGVVCGSGGGGGGGGGGGEGMWWGWLIGIKINFGSWYITWSNYEGHG